jgi:hypothetical protein
MEVMDTQSHLLEIVAALHPAGGFTRRLDGRKQKGDEHADDGNNNEKFDKGKGVSLPEDLP